MQLCVCCPCQERVTTAWLCVLHQQKNNVSTGLSTMVWEMVVLSPYFSYFCFHVLCLSLTEVTTEVKLIRVFTGRSSQRLQSQAWCHIFHIHTAHAANVTTTKVCVFHISVKIQAGDIRNITEKFSGTGKEKNTPPLLQFIQYTVLNSNWINLFETQTKQIDNQFNF